MLQVTALNVSDTTTIAGRLKSIALPAAVVWGAADAFQKLEYGRRLSVDLGAELVQLPGGKHFTPEDHPETIAGAVNSLLQR